MARAPRASVPKTSGQGVSRLSYQKGRAMGNRGGSTPDGGVPSAGKVSMAELKEGRGGKRSKGGGSSYDVGYGNTLPISNLDDITGYDPGKPDKGAHFKPGKPKDYAKK